MPYMLVGLFSLLKCFKADPSSDVIIYLLFSSHE